MTRVSVSLCGRELSRAIPFEEKEFAFFVGEDEYKCSRFRACAMSDRVRQMMACDRSVTGIVLQVSGLEKSMGDVRCLMGGGEVVVNAENAETIASLGRELDNKSVLRRVARFRTRNEELSMDNVIELMNLKHDIMERCDAEIEYLAKHFYECSFDFLCDLSVDDLEAVVEHPSLRLCYEDNLLDVVLRLVREKDTSYGVLLTHVKFMYLTYENLNVFLENVFPDAFNAMIWGEVCECLRLSHRNKTKLPCLLERHKNHVEPNDDQPLRGIIRLIQQEGKAKTGEVELSSSSDYSGYSPQSVVDYDTNNSWLSDDKEQSSLTFHFTKIKVSATMYTIKSGSSGTWGQPRKWVLEGSDDGTEGSWTTIDDRETDELVNNYSVVTFRCNHRNRQFYPFLRIRQTGTTNTGHHGLRLCNVEFFGDYINYS